MIHHRPIAFLLAGLSLASAMLSGCSVAPEPRPTPTAAFASEEEAFAAAEETFENYIEALNSIDTANPDTFDPLFDLSSGAVEKADRENFSAMHAEGWKVQGESHIVSFSGISSEPPFSSVKAEACLDVSGVTITDHEGASRVDPARPDVYPLTVIFASNENHHLRVDKASPTEDIQCPAP